MGKINSKNFITDNFILQTSVAETLYHSYAKNLPIIDYHNHLSAKQIAENKPVKNITEVWLKGDHYKWRALRANGIDEHYITGAASQKEKFLKWAETVPFTLRNPLFDWTHLELKRYFNIDEILQPSTAEVIYDKTNAVLAEKTPANLLEDLKVEVVCTTDDPVDDLKYHKEIATSKNYTKVFPTFRPDTLILIEDTDYGAYIKKLEQCVGFAIKNLEEFLKAIENRIDYFDAVGCRLADYGLEKIYAFDFTEEEANTILNRRLSGVQISNDEANLFSSYLLDSLCKMYHAKGWVQQFHLGALRNNNKRLLKEVGLDAGVDSIGDFTSAKSMSKFFNKLDESN